MKTGSGSVPKPKDFQSVFHRFQTLVTENWGAPFVAFDEGRATVWEGYKERLRDRALGFLRADAWVETDIGSVAIAQQAIRAIEIQETGDMVNNLVFWQNRFGHANRDHRILIECASEPKLCREVEALLFTLYRGDIADEGRTFEALRELSGAKYPFLAYLYFLKDIDRFMPIQPTGFDRAFTEMEIDFKTLRNCGWENYCTYNAVLDALRKPIAEESGLGSVRLIDAHSFCWIFASLLRIEAQGSLGASSGRNDEGRKAGTVEKAIYRACYTVANTTRNANGQLVERTVKNKDLEMPFEALKDYVTDLVQLQEGKCALTGIPFDFDEKNGDPRLFLSVDRKDSEGHYGRQNIQLVCSFVNFWKGTDSDDEFRRLLALVRGGETS